MAAVVQGKASTNQASTNETGKLKNDVTKTSAASREQVGKEDLVNNAEDLRDVLCNMKEKLKR